MGKPVRTLSVRTLVLQMLAHTLLFATQNAGNIAEQVLLASDAAATAAIGLNGTAFGLLTAFTMSLVGVCQFVVGRRAGEGDAGGARAAARQGLLMAGAGGALGLTLAGATAITAVFASGPARGAALYLTAQGLALGPLLAARVLTDYFAGTLRVGPRLLAAVCLLPVAVHLTLAWLLMGVLSWSVAGAGLARLGAALAAVAAALAVVGAEPGGLVGPPQRHDRTLLWTMFTEGSVLGLKQVAANSMVLLLYLRAAAAGDVTSAALTLTLAGLYPLLFAFAWGSSQAVGAAAAQAVGRGDARELTRITWLGLGLASALAFVGPWGVYALCGRTTLAWLVGGSPAGDGVLTAAARFMGLLAVFFVFDFAINFLSALLKAAKEQVYLLKVTAATAAGFALLLLALPLASEAWLLELFICVQAVRAGLLFVRVVTRWPGTVARRGRVEAAPGVGRGGHVVVVPTFHP